MFRRVDLCKLNDVKRGTYCLHHQGSLMVEAVYSFETSVNFYQTPKRSIAGEGQSKRRTREHCIKTDLKKWDINMLIGFMWLKITSALVNTVMDPLV